MKKGILAIGMMVMLLASSGDVFAKAYSDVMTKDKQNSMSPQEVFERLKDGNKRYVDGNMKNRDLLAQAKKTSSGQYPVAVILNCMDSRTPPELVFDQGVGDVFVTRVAGNVENKDIIGSMEYGTKVVGAKLIAVIGHTECGAIKGACEKVQLGNLTGLLDKIHPAMINADKQDKNTSCSNPQHIDQITRNNVLLVIENIKKQSPVIDKLVKEGKLGIVGGVQDIKTGKVDFIKEASYLP